MIQCISDLFRTKFLLIAFATISLVSFGLNDAYAAIPTITLFEADDPDNGDAVFSNDDTILIRFSEGVNATNGGTMTSGEFAANFTIGVTGAFDGTFSGTWQTPDANGPTELLITWTVIGANTPMVAATTIDDNAATTTLFDGATQTFKFVEDGTDTLTGDFGVVAGGGGGDSSGSGIPSGGYQPPTMGVTKRGMVLVEDGFSYNNNPVDAHLMNTPYPLVTTNVGEENVAKLKIYSPRGIDRLQHVALAFGLDKYQIFGESNVVIEWDKLPNGKESLTVIDPNNYLDNVRVVTSQGDCRTNGNDQCFIIEFYHTFRQPLEYNIIGTYIWDDKRSGWQNYYNDGVEIIGDSLNPPAKHQVSHNGKLIEITESGKNVAHDQDGNLWMYDKSWIIEYQPKGKIDDGLSSKGIDRNNVRFSAYQKGQELIADYQLKTSIDGSKIKNNQIEESKSFDIDFTKRINDIELQNRLAYELEKAKDLFSDNYVITDDDQFQKYWKIHQQFIEKYS